MILNIYGSTTLEDQVLAFAIFMVTERGLITRYLLHPFNHYPSLLLNIFANHMPPYVSGEVPHIFPFTVSMEDTPKTCVKK